MLLACIIWSVDYCIWGPSSICSSCFVLAIHYHLLICVAGIALEELGVRWHQPTLDQKVLALGMCFRFALLLLKCGISVVLYEILNIVLVIQVGYINSLERMVLKNVELQMDLGKRHFSVVEFLVQSHFKWGGFFFSFCSLFKKRTRGELCVL